jgi:hypothetical protein
MIFDIEVDDPYILLMGIGKRFIQDFHQISNTEYQMTIYQAYSNSKSDPEQYKLSFNSEEKNILVIEFINGKWDLLESDRANLFYKISGPPVFDMSDYKTTHIVTANLNLMLRPDNTALVSAILSEDTAVQILEEGNIAIVNDITARWVRIISSEGISGWCFGGYLAEYVPVVAVQSPEAETAGPESIELESAVVEQTATGIPSAVIFAIAGGVLVVAAVAVMLIRRKR